jgi:hypothetical protein
MQACQSADFGVLIPQDRFSMSVRLELVGKEKITIRGAERELMRLNLNGEDMQWNLWAGRSRSLQAHTRGDSCR